jgi:hypothetical protein
VFNAAYDSDWYNQSEHYKHCIRMIIMRAQRPVELTASRFGTLSLPLYASVSVKHVNYYHQSFFAIQNFINNQIS